MRGYCASGACAPRRSCPPPKRRRLGWCPPCHPDDLAWPPSGRAQCGLSLGSLLTPGICHMSVGFTSTTIIAKIVFLITLVPQEQVTFFDTFACAWFREMAWLCSYSLSLSLSTFNIYISLFNLHPVWPDWAIFWTLGHFLKPVAAINLPKSPTF